MIKRLASATVLGAVSGLVCVGVRVALNLLQQLLTGSAGLLAESAQRMPPWRRVATPALGGLLAMAVLFLAARMLPREEPVDYIDAIRKQKPIPLLSAVVRVISSGFSIATGAAIGREGSMIQFATACVSGVADLRPTWFPDRRRYLAYGLAAAVGSVYRAPFAGIFFAMEIGFGCLDFRETVPLAVASGMGWMCSRELLRTGPLFAMPQALHLRMAEVLPALLLALTAALLAPLYFRLLHGSAVLAKVPLALVWSGLIVGALSLISTQVWGNGDSAMLAVVSGTPSLRMLACVVLLRLIASTVCVGSGAIGGVFTPTIFLGAGLGSVAASLLHRFQPSADAMLFTLVGLACFLAAVTHAPILSALMAAELTGHLPAVPLLLVLCFGAAWVSRRLEPRSLYAAASDRPTEAASPPAPRLGRRVPYRASRRKTPDNEHRTES